MSVSIATVRLRIALEFTFAASSCRGQRGIVVFNKVKEVHWEEK